MNTDNPETPAQTTSPLNFGGSTPFSENEAVTQPESLDNGEAGALLAAGTEVPVEETLAAHSEAPTEEQSVTATTETQNAPVEQANASPADLAPNAEVPATPQTELEAEVVKELEVHASNPTEAVATSGIPEEAPVIAGNSDADIEKQIAERDALNARIEENMKNQRVDVITQIKKVVETYKIPLPELAEALGIKGTRKGSKAKPKYRNPADGKEWSGRGKEPLWIKGQDRTKFLIV